MAHNIFFPYSYLQTCNITLSLRKFPIYVRNKFSNPNLFLLTAYQQTTMRVTYFAQASSGSKYWKYQVTGRHEIRQTDTCMSFLQWLELQSAFTNLKWNE